MCLRRKGKSKVLSSRFCLRDSEPEQRPLQFLHIITQLQTVTLQLLNQFGQNPQEKASLVVFYANQLNAVIIFYSVIVPAISLRLRWVPLFCRTVDILYPRRLEEDL